MPGCATASPSNDISSGRTINYMRLGVNELQTSSGQLVMHKAIHASPGRGTLVPASLFLNLFNDTSSSNEYSRMIHWEHEEKPLWGLNILSNGGTNGKSGETPIVTDAFSAESRCGDLYNENGRYRPLYGESNVSLNASCIQMGPWIKYLTVVPLHEFNNIISA
jgi:hypothetical protein